MPKRLFVLLVFGLSIVTFFHSELSLHLLFEINSFVIVFGILAPIVFILWQRGVAHWSESTLALGVPLGLLGGTVGVTGMANNLSLAYAAYPASAIMLLTVLYGGIVSALGYFAVHRAPPSNGQLSLASLVSILFLFASIIVWMMIDSGGLSLYLSAEAASVFLAVLAWQTFANKQLNFQRLAEGALFAAILCLILALIQWYNSGGLDRDAINLAINGLNYGLVIYIVAYIVSLSQEETRSGRIETGRANWHWMEVTAFMIFMLFAPETLRETLMNEQDDEAQVEETELLEQRLARLEQRISDIESK